MWEKVVLNAKMTNFQHKKNVLSYRTDVVWVVRWYAANDVYTYSEGI